MNWLDEDGSEPLKVEFSYVKNSNKAKGATVHVCGCRCLTTHRLIDCNCGGAVFNTKERT